MKANIYFSTSSLDFLQKLRLSVFGQATLRVVATFLKRHHYAKLPFTGCLLLLSLTACTNQFKYEKNDWAYVTETTQGEKETAYIDRNRIECKDGQCRTWVKMVFNNDQVVPYSGDEKKGTKSGYLMIKRVDSSVDYDCSSGTVRMNSYQLYDGDKLIDTKWVKSELEYAKPGTVHYDLWKYVCEKKRN